MNLFILWVVVICLVIRAVAQDILNINDDDRTQLYYDDEDKRWKE